MVKTMDGIKMAAEKIEGIAVLLVMLENIGNLSDHTYKHRISLFCIMGSIFDHAIINIAESQYRFDTCQDPDVKGIKSEKSRSCILLSPGSNNNI